jgi:hypothetical protein
MGDSYAVDTRALYFVNFPIVPPGSPPKDTIALAGGNPGLKPEKAKTYSAGVEYNPPFLSGFHASVTYWKIDYTGLIRIAPISPEIFTNPAFASFYVLNPTQAQIDAIARNFRVVQTTLPIPPGRGADHRPAPAEPRRHSYQRHRLRLQLPVGYLLWRLRSRDLGLADHEIRPAIGDRRAVRPAEQFHQDPLAGRALLAQRTYLGRRGLNHSGEYDQTYNLAAGGTKVQRVRRLQQPRPAHLLRPAGPVLPGRDHAVAERRQRPR